MSAKDSGHSIRVLLRSFYASITGWEVQGVGFRVINVWGLDKIQSEVKFE